MRMQKDLRHTTKTKNGKNEEWGAILEAFYNNRYCDV
jgi:hypothetical protein